MLNISTGCEPFFALSYNRRTESLNGEETIYQVEVGAVEEYRKITGNTGELPDYFTTSNRIHYKSRIEVQAALQDFVDTAISSTINLSKDTTIDDVKDLYLYSWKKGLKGCTIFIEGSRDAILSTSTTNEESKKEKTSELKRGDIIKAGDNWIGLKRTLTTGCGTLHCTAYFDPNSGELRECYLSKGSTGGW